MAYLADNSTYPHRHLTPLRLRAGAFHLSVSHTRKARAMTRQLLLTGPLVLPTVLAVLFGKAGGPIERVGCIPLDAPADATGTMRDPDRPSTYVMQWIQLP